METVLIDTFTRVELEMVLADELGLADRAELEDPNLRKRDIIRHVTAKWGLDQLADMSRRILNELNLVNQGELESLVAEHEHSRGGVRGSIKNLIFAANGPKPELVLRDAVNNDVEITRNAEFCLIYDREIPPEGLTWKTLIDWWRDRESLSADLDDRAVGLRLYERLRDSVRDNPVEDLVFRTYSKRYGTQGFGIPALVPQVYLHYDPYTKRQRGGDASQLARQRMDFLMLFSDRRRVVLEVDGRQHYADDSGKASPQRYSEMVSEDRRLRLTGYEVYRFGGYELGDPAAETMLTSFFDSLHSKST
jgi:hypothetical protein